MLIQYCRVPNSTSVNSSKKQLQQDEDNDNEQTTGQ